MNAADLEAQVAQSVEQRTENPRVGGSIPPLGTIHKTASHSGAFLWMEFRGWMRFIDVVRPIAKQLATSAPARSSQGTNTQIAAADYRLRQRSISTARIMTKPVMSRLKGSETPS